MIDTIDPKSNYQFVIISKKYKDLFKATLQVAPPCAKKLSTFSPFLLHKSHLAKIGISKSSLSTLTDCGQTKDENWNSLINCQMELGETFTTELYRVLHIWQLRDETPCKYLMANLDDNNDSPDVSETPRRRVRAPKKTDEVTDDFLREEETSLLVYDFLLWISMRLSVYSSPDSLRIPTT